MRLVKCPDSGLLLPPNLIDEKQSLKKSIDSVLEQIVNQMQHIRENYFVVFHGKFTDQNNFSISKPTITKTLPPFVTNQMVFWVSNTRGLCELLWMVKPTAKGEKPQVEFNKKGVAYLQAKGAMPS